MKKIKILVVSLLMGSVAYAQPPSGNSGASPNWRRGGNVLGGGNPPNANIFGTMWASPIHIYTGGTHIAQFTTGSSLNCLVGNNGDGLRIRNTYLSGVGGNLDMFTSYSNGQNETHIRFGNNGQISGQANRLEIRGYSQLGLWYNTEIASSMHIFAKAGAEQARIGTNNFYRIGENPNNNNAIRRLEVFQKGKAPQFRITANQNSSTFVDFRARNNGNLNILPSGGKVGVNLNSNPTHTMDINGRLRIRQVQTVSSPQSLLIGQQFGGSNSRVVRRLDFTGNANDVLLGNGTWGTVNTIDTANNGTTVNSNNIIQWGQDCGALGNPAALLNDREIPMGNNKIYFSGNSQHILLGNVSCTSGTDATLLINNNVGISNTQIALKASSYGNSSSIGGYFIGNRVAVDAYSSGGGNFSTGVRGFADGGLQSNIGGDFNTSGNADLNIGVRGSVNTSLPSTYNYGVYAYAPIISQGPPPKTAALYAQGDAIVTGTTFLFNPSVPVSDQQFKTNINSLTSAISIIDQMNPVTFNFTSNTYNDRVNFTQNLQYGFIAQEIEQFLPDLVSEGHLAPALDSVGNVLAPALFYKALNYNGFFAILTKGIQEQQAQIDSLTNASDAKDSIIAAMQTQLNDVDARLAHLESCLSGVLPQLCQMSNSAIQQNNEQAQEELINQIEVILDNSQNIVLEQNVPNPFTEQTTINYFIPDNVEKAQIHFYNQMGQLIKTINVTQRGQGRLNVYASDLSTGAYTYTLIADGKAVTTKKMIKE